MKNSFEQYRLKDFLIDALNKQGITKPTDVQQQAIAPILKKKDIIGQSQTGSGKTLAYLLPLIHNIDLDKQEPQVLIIAPTRELITQISDVAVSLSEGTEIDLVQLQGGVDVNRQIQRLKRNPHIIVGTPGRVLDLIQDGKLSVQGIEAVVIDEADTIIQMGFMDEVEQIIQQLKRNSQIMLFSATIPQEVAVLARKFMNNPTEIKINPQERSVDAIENVFFKVRTGGKEEALAKLVKLYNPYLAIVFANKKEQVDELVTRLIQAGFQAEGLHGDLQQRQRKQVMKRFKDAKTQILVATDIASRGLDVESISHIFNYDLPINVDQYIHRIGRTGRAGETGIAISLIVENEETKLNRIEEKLGKTFEEKIIYKDEIIDKPRRGKKKLEQDKREAEKERNKRPVAPKAKTKKFTGPNAKRKAAEAAKRNERRSPSKKEGNPTKSERKPRTK